MGGEIDIMEAMGGTPLHVVAMMCDGLNQKEKAEWLLAHGAARDGVTQKQRNTIAQFAAVSGLPPPDLERMGHAEAAAWIARAWHGHIEGGGGGASQA